MRRSNPSYRKRRFLLRMWRYPIPIAAKGREDLCGSVLQCVSRRRRSRHGRWTEAGRHPSQIQYHAVDGPAKGADGQDDSKWDDAFGFAGRRSDCACSISGIAKELGRAVRVRILAHAVNRTSLGESTQRDRRGLRN